MADWPFPCYACSHPAHRGGECSECVCCEVPFEWASIERQWVAFRYRDGSAWRVPGREGKWVIIRIGDDDALLYRYGCEGEWLARTDANLFDLMPWTEEKE